MQVNHGERVEYLPTGQRGFMTGYDGEFVLVLFDGRSRSSACDPEDLRPVPEGDLVEVGGWYFRSVLCWLAIGASAPVLVRAAAAVEVPRGLFRAIVALAIVAIVCAVVRVWQLTAALDRQIDLAIKAREDWEEVVPVVRDKAQGLDCWMCEQSRPHVHKRRS